MYMLVAMPVYVHAPHASLQIPYKICDRRPGDIAAGYADPKLAEQEMGWKATRGIDDMCKILITDYR